MFNLKLPANQVGSRKGPIFPSRTQAVATVAWHRAISVNMGFGLAKPDGPSFVGGFVA